MAVEGRAPDRQRIERRAVDEDEAVHRLLGIVGPMDREVDDIGRGTTAEEIEDPAGRGLDRRRGVDAHEVGRLCLRIDEPLPTG